MEHDTLFQKRVLIPFWTLRLALMLFLLGLYSWALAVLASWSPDNDPNDIFGDSGYSDSDLEAVKTAGIAFVTTLSLLLYLD